MQRRRRSGESGQAMVETAIITPIVIFLILGSLQIVMLQHGRIMTEYAAYNAARAGIVHNGNWNIMRNAALISALPLYERTDNLVTFGRAWLKIKAVAEVTEAADTAAATLERVTGDLLGVEIGGVAQDVSLIEVHVTSPDDKAYRASRRHQSEMQRAALDIDAKGPLQYGEGEIDFDDVEFLKDNPDAGRLGVEVRVLYPLRIPIVNKIIFELWLAQILLNSRRVNSNLTEWAQFKARVEGGRNSGQYLEEAVAQADGAGPTDDFFTTRQWIKEVRTLRWIAERTGRYLLPLRATHAMQMQSNAFEGNRREPVWFSLD